MPDDLDDRIRAAMKVLDEATPSGYFDAAPNQILSRLEDGSMQHGTGTSATGNKRDMNALIGAAVPSEDADTNPTPRVEASDVGPLPTAPAAAATAVTAAAPAVTAAKPATADRDEDSGLHDIRNLAQSTKQRLSAKRITQNPPTNDDVLASSSGSFAGIALPQPAKMVSLPELEDLPSKQEVIAAQKAAAKARKEKKPTIEPTLASKDVLAPQATANAALAAMSAAPIAAATAADVPSASSSAAVPVRQAFTLPSMERKTNKGPIFAILGLGVAAAAGGLIYMNTQGDEKKSAQVAAADQAPAAPEPVKAEPVAAAAAGSAAVEAAPPPPPAPAPEETKAAEAPVAADTQDDDKPGRKRAAKGAKKDEPEAHKVPEVKIETPKVEEKKADPKEIKTPDGTKKVKGEGEGEPSFDALLKEAGVEDKKEAKPKLEKKSLSGDDFKKGMAAVQAKAQGCYKGTQGTASVKLTVAPDGKVSKVSVAGQFAGSPEGACVEKAVKSASFPAWDGGPQSFNYSYMLAD